MSRFKIQSIVFVFSLMLVAPAAMAISPMPEQPTIHGVRFVFWHQFERLRKSIEQFLNPDSEDGYLYRGISDLAPDLSLDFRAHEAMYEQLLVDYQTFLNSGTMDDFDSFNYPLRYRLRVKLSEAILKHSFSNHYEFAKLLTIMNKTLVDRRYLSTFLFFTTMDRRHKPLESMASLSRSSVQGQAILQKLMDRIRMQLAKASTDLTNLVAVANEPSPNLHQLTESLNQFISESDHLNYRLTYIVEKLYGATQFANDIMNDRAGTIDLKGLEEKIAALGDGLNTILKAVEKYRGIRLAGIPRQEAGEVKGIWLSQPNTDLNKMVGALGHFGGYTMFAQDRGPEDVHVYSHYVDAILLQYVLAAGMAMAKIYDLPEGRGGWTDRLTQEWRYRQAQLQNRARSSAPSMPKSALVAYDSRSQTAQAPVRRAFATPDLQQAREDLEARLWQIFFDHAALVQFDERARQNSCLALLANDVLALPMLGSPQ